MSAGGVDLIGGRCVATGSASFATALRSGDDERIAALCTGQVRAGASILNVNVDLDDRDWRADQARVLPLAAAAGAPVMVDSRHPDRLRAGMRALSGLGWLNSVTLAGRGAAQRELLREARDQGWGAIALALGSARPDATAREKRAEARALLDAVCGDGGLAPDSVLVDLAVLPVSAGSRYLALLLDIAAELSAGGVRVSLGVQNASWGAPGRWRGVLDAVLLARATARGVAATHVDVLTLPDPRAIHPADRAAAGRYLDGESQLPPAPRPVGADSLGPPDRMGPS